jgi:tetratricopeptide (TPR) repeat protein
MFVKAFPCLAFMQIAEDMENSEDVADVPNDAKPPDAEVAAPRSRLRILARIAIFAGLFAVPLAVSWQLREHFTDDEIVTAPVERPDSASKKAEPAGNAAEILERGDQALALHRFARALAHYEELLERQPDSAALVAYRIGLCNESLGQLDNAHAAYRKAISQTAAPALTVAAHLGVARCLVRGQHPAEARQLLYPFVLDEARQQGVPAPLLTGMRYLIALAFAQETLHTATPRLDNERLLSYTSVSLEMPFYLDEISTSAKTREEKMVETLAPPLSLQKLKTPAETLILRVEQGEQPVCTLLDHLATQAGLRTEWTAEAKKHLEDRTLRLTLRNWLLMDLFDQLADRFDLVWQLEGDAVRFSTAAQVDGKLSSQAKRDATKRALRAALLTDANHPWTPAVLLELGNGEAAHGKSAKAVIWFERLIRNTPAAPQVAPACFNLALLHLRDQQYALARQTWFRVIDHVPGHELALRAHLRIAQSYLEEDNPREAVIQLRRAQAVAPGSLFRPITTLLLAAAHLQLDEPENARSVLTKNRADLLKEPCKATAAFLDAYAQYRAAKPANGGRREGSELLNSLWQDLDDNPLGPIGYSLIARALHELGFLEQAEQRWRQALQQSRGAYVAALEYSLGEALLKQDRRADAVALFEKLAAAPSLYRARARFQLAQADLYDKQFSACEEKCRQLWAEGSIAETAALLHAWGSALEGMGEFGKAAQCFAGKAPK